MSSLRSFPFDKIKIDQSFISGVENNPPSAAIVRSIIGLGKALEIPVIAEGVETEGERAFLKREGCDEIQGFLIGRPAPIANYADLTSGSARMAAKAGKVGADENSAPPAKGAAAARGSVAGQLVLLAGP